MGCVGLKHSVDVLLFVVSLVDVRDAAQPIVIKCVWVVDCYDVGSLFEVNPGDQQKFVIIDVFKIVPVNDELQKCFAWKVDGEQGGDREEGESEFYEARVWVRAAIEA